MGITPWWDAGVATWRKLEREVQLGCEACLWIVRSCTNDVYDHGCWSASPTSWRPLMSAGTLPVSIMSWVCCKRLLWWKSFLPVNMSFSTIFRDDSLARTKGSLVNWTVLVSSLLPLSQMLLAGRRWTWLVSRKTELNVWCLGFLVTRSTGYDFCWTQPCVCFRAHERACVFNSCDSSWSFPGAQTNENELHEMRVFIIAGDSPDPHLRQREHRITLLRPHNGTLLRRLSTPRTRTMTAVTPLIRAICKSTYEMNSRYWPLAWTMVKNDTPIQGVDNSQLETACLKLAELPEALAIVQAAPERSLIP